MKQSTVQIVQPNRAVLYGILEALTDTELFVRVGRMTYRYRRDTAQQNRAGAWSVNALPALGTIQQKTANLH